MRRRMAWSSLAAVLIVATPTASAHDGGVVAIITATLTGGLFVGAMGGTLSGWFGRGLAACMVGTLVICAAGLVLIELTSDPAVAKNFCANIAFLAPFAAIPIALGYLVAHIVGVMLRGKKKVSREAPNSTVETDAREGGARGSP